MKRPLITLLLSGLLLRIVLLFAAYSWDVNSHITWGKEVLERGITGFYDRPTIDHFSTIYPNYPPVSIYCFTIMYEVYSLCKIMLWQLNIHIPVFPSALVTWFDSREAMAGFMKLPAVLADIGIGYILYKMILAYKRDHLSALFAVVFFLFNPVFWYTSALWGQIDSIPIFFVLLSFYTLLYTDRKLLPVIIFTLALLSKQTSSIFILLLIVAYLKKYSVASFLKSIGISIVMFWIFFVPFYQQGNILLFPFQTYIQRILTVSGIPFASNHAFNFWALVTQWTDIADTTQGLGMSYRAWGYSIAVLLMIPAYWFACRRVLSSKSLYFTALVTALTVFLFFTRIHERHIQQGLIFFIPFAVFDKKIRIMYWTASFIHMANLYHNWSTPRIESLVSVVLSPVTFNTLTIVLIGIYCYLIYLYFRRSSWSQKDSTV